MLALLIVLQSCIQCCVVYVYCVELFRTRVRSTAMSMSITLSRTISGFSTYLIYLMDSLHLHPMSCLWLVGLTALLSAYFLPETKHKGLLN